jgi:hypothetical protein
MAAAAVGRSEGGWMMRMRVGPSRAKVARRGCSRRGRFGKWKGWRPGVGTRGHGQGVSEGSKVWVGRGILSSALSSQIHRDA